MPSKTGSQLSFFDWYLQAGLMHLSEQSDGLHGNGLASRVRPRDHEHRPVRSDAHIDRDGAFFKKRVAQAREPKDSRRSRLGGIDFDGEADSVHLRSVPRSREYELQACGDFGGH